MEIEDDLVGKGQPVGRDRKPPEHSKTIAKSMVFKGPGKFKEMVFPFECGQANLVSPAGEHLRS